MTNESNNSVYAIVLAAGSASRFGSTKQLVELDSISLARRATTLAAGSCDSRSVLVVGHDWHAVLEACAPLQGFLIVNDRHEDGIGRSIALAVRSIRHAAKAVLVLLADQPLITAAHVAALIAQWSGDDQEIVATSYAGTKGAPALFPAATFDHLAALHGDQGARSLLDDPQFFVREIVFEDAAIDIDTEEDLTRISRNARN